MNELHEQPGYSEDLKLSSRSLSRQVKTFKAEREAKGKVEESARTHEENPVTYIAGT